MTEEKIIIQSISIKLVTKDFDQGYKLENKEKIEKDIKDFKKNHHVIKEYPRHNYDKSICLEYYSGQVTFKPVKEGGASLKMEVNLPPDAIKSVAAMCLDNVCEVCEKQTKAFQDTFVNYVKENSEALTDQNEKIKKGLISRGLDKLQLK